jgi:hypothetical protein
VIPNQRPDDLQKKTPNISSMKLVPVGLLLIVLSFLILSVLIWALSIGSGLYILMVPVIVFALIGILRPNWGEEDLRSSVNDEQKPTKGSNDPLTATAIESKFRSTK